MKRSLALVLSFVMAMLLCVTAVAFTVNAEEENPCLKPGNLNGNNGEYIVNAEFSGTNFVDWTGTKKDPSYLYDGDVATQCWSNTKDFAVTFEYKEISQINSIKVSANGGPDWAGNIYTIGVYASLSDDGVNWGTPIAAAENVAEKPATPITEFNITVNDSAKFVKITADSGDWWVSYGEVVVDGLMIVHTWDDGEVTAEATCAEVGNKHYACKFCDASRDEEIPMIGHEIDPATYAVLEAPTCTKAGKITGTCVNCEQTFEEATAIEIPALDHNYGAFVVTLEPTCTAKGSKSKICASCGDVVTEEIAALGDKAHVYDPTSYTDVVPATCVAAGSAKANCVICGAEGVEIVIPQLAHTYSEAMTYVTLEPTCLEKGQHTAVCLVCGYKNVLTDISALGHDYDAEWTIVEAATCTEKGTRTKGCSRCEAVKTEKYLLDHDFEVVDTEATCTTDGVKSKICKECGYEEYNNVTKATGHALSQREVAPTCELAGYVEETCANCDYSARKSEIAATGHQYEEVRVEPTEEAEGSVNKQCKVCGALDPSFEAQVLPKVKKSFIDMILEFFASLFGGKD